VPTNTLLCIKTLYLDHVCARVNWHVRLAGQRTAASGDGTRARTRNGRYNRNRRRWWWNMN